MTPAESGTNLEAAAGGTTYSYINNGRPPKILESPMDSKSLLSGEFICYDDCIVQYCNLLREMTCYVTEIKLRSEGAQISKIFRIFR